MLPRAGGNQRRYEGVIKQTEDHDAGHQAADGAERAAADAADAAGLLFGVHPALIWGLILLTVFAIAMLRRRRTSPTGTDNYSAEQRMNVEIRRSRYVEAMQEQYNARAKAQQELQAQKRQHDEEERARLAAAAALKPKPPAPAPSSVSNIREFSPLDGYGGGGGGGGGSFKSSRSCTKRGG